MGEQDHTWEEGNPTQTDKENPTGILANVNHPEDKFMIVPMDIPDEIAAKDAVLVDRTEDVVWDLTYVYDDQSEVYKRQGAE